MEWKERDVHVFCFTDNPKNRFRKTFSPLNSLHERVNLAVACAKPLGSREPGSLPAPALPASRTGPALALFPFQPLTSHSTYPDW